MLKVADNLHEKGSKEWRDERDKIRNDWKEEKATGITNKNYKIDSSGSAPKDTSKEISQKQTVSDSQKHHSNIGGTQHGSSGMTKSQHSAFRN
jgi:hypothetical protein